MRQIVLPGSTSSSRTTCRAARSSSVAGGSSAGSSKSLHSSPATAGDTGGRSWVGGPGRIRGGRRHRATPTRSRIQAPARAAAPTRIGIEKVVSSELDVAASTPEMSTAHHRVPGGPGIVSAAMRRVPLALVVIVLSGCGLEFGGGRGATRQGRDIFGLWQGSVIVALLVGGLVWGLIVFAVLRYRRRNDDLPSQTQYFVKLEILYTVVPVIIVAVLFAFSYRTQNDVDALSSNPAVTIDVKGFQWQWQFHYRDDDVTVTGLPDKVPTMVLPVDRTVRLVLTSPAPQHGDPAVADEHRPQGDRAELPGDVVRVLLHRRSPRARHANAARAAEPERPEPGDVQRVLHDARQHHDVPVRRAVRVRARELHRPAPDRRARRGVPASQRARLLDVPVRRARDDLGVPHRQRRGELRMVLVRAALRGDLCPRRRARPVDRRRDRHEHRDRARRRQPRHDDLHAARA